MGHCRSLPHSRLRLPLLTWTWSSSPAQIIAEIKSHQALIFTWIRISYSRHLPPICINTSPSPHPISCSISQSHACFLRWPLRAPSSLYFQFNSQLLIAPLHYSTFNVLYSLQIHPLLYPGPIQPLTQTFSATPPYLFLHNDQSQAYNIIMVNSPPSSIITANPNLYTTVPHCTTNFLPVLSFDLPLDVCLSLHLASYIFAFRSSVDAIKCCTILHTLTPNFSNAVFSMPTLLFRTTADSAFRFFRDGPNQFSFLCSRCCTMLLGLFGYRYSWS